MRSIFLLWLYGAIFVSLSEGAYSFHRVRFALNVYPLLSISHSLKFDNDIISRIHHIHYPHSSSFLPFLFHFANRPIRSFARLFIRWSPSNLLFISVIVLHCIPSSSRQCIASKNAVALFYHTPVHQPTHLHLPSNGNAAQAIIYNILFNSVAYCCRSYPPQMMLTLSAFSL